MGPKYESDAPPVSTGTSRNCASIFSTCKISVMKTAPRFLQVHYPRVRPEIPTGVSKVVKSFQEQRVMSLTRSYVKVQLGA